MAYVDYNYYTDVYLGDSVSPEAFLKCEARAEELIDAITRYQIADARLSSFSPRLQNQIRSAVCAQMDYYAEYGMSVALDGQDGGGFTVGKVTVHGGGSDNAVGAYTMACPKAMLFLEQTGLLNPAVPTFGGRWP